MKIIGNFLSQGAKDFPLDCETFDALQSNTAMIAALGNLGGDKLILSGCTLSSDGTRRSEGYIFLRTQAYPSGEVLHFEGGAVANGLYVKTENIAVSAQGYEYPAAYTHRTLAVGMGTEHYNWADFRTPRLPHQLETDLRNAINALTQRVNQIAPAPLGIVEMWAGRNVPSGYLLCNGAELSQAEYPALYAALGGTFNSARDHRGSVLTTRSGYFRLPDLRGRFIVGGNDTDEDYNGQGKTGGEKMHRLSTDEIPPHSHRHKMPTEATNTWKSGGNASANNATASWPTAANAVTENSGGGAPHENRPPYYVLAYIMRVR